MDGVRVSGLLKRYGDVVAVDDLSMDFDKGTLTTLLGPSGCGKTTTLRCIAGLERADRGVISIDDRIVFSKEVNIPPEKRMVGIVFQSYAIWPHMTVFENIAFPLKIRHASRQDIDERVRRMMDLVRLSDLGDRPATQVSGGQQQRIALARALVFDPDVLLLDEPLSNLDTSLRDLVRVEVREIQKSLKMTTIYVTHDQGEALSMSDKVVVMKAGKVMAVGPPEDIYKRPPNDFVASFVGKANMIQGSIDSMAPGSLPNRPDERLATIETSFGRAMCHIHGQTTVMKEKDRVLLMIKPENVEILSGADNSNKKEENKSNQEEMERGEDSTAAREALANTYPARVDYVSYLGAFSEVIVRVDAQGREEEKGRGGGRADQMIRVLRTSESVSLRPGQKVRVRLPEEYCSLLPMNGSSLSAR
jgi:iron(III) transport system ATP-binding protein